MLELSGELASGFCGAKPVDHVNGGGKENAMAAQAGCIAQRDGQVAFADHAAPGMIGTMPGTGLCRVTWHFPSNDRLFGPAYSGGPVEVISHSRGSEFTICALNDSVINFTCKVRGAHMRRPAQSPHRLVSSKTGRVRLHAVPGPVLSAVLCEA